MSRNYQKPPLVEAFCEFQFGSESWDWTIPGLIYQIISDRFPKKRTVKRLELQINPATKELIPGAQGDTERLQFLSEDETLLVQAGSNMLAVNSVAKYPPWRDFRVLIHEMFNVYREIANPTSIKRIGLRYINRIQIPEVKFDLATFFNLEPKLPDELPENLASLFMRVELPNPSDSGILILTFGSAPEKLKDQSAFILDLDFSTTPNPDVKFESQQDWVDAAHTNIETAFEACITDRLRELFEEIKS